VRTLTLIKARSESADPAAYAEAVKGRYPDNHDPIWADFGSRMLYGLINP
jgi:hypothetical protein